MARVSRTRTKPSPFNGGISESWINGNHNVAGDVSPNRSGYTSRCIDFHGRPVVDSPFDSDQYAGTYPSVTGSIQGKAPYLGYKNILKGFTFSSLPLEMTGMSPLAAPSGWELDVIAGTNPSRASIGIPMWAQNLAELPGMVRQLGKILIDPKGAARPKGFADNFLGVKFGWLPLIDDLRKLLEFQKHVIKRNKELHQLYSGKGLRRRLQIGNDTTNIGTIASTALAATATVTLYCSLSITRKSWGTIHWKPAVLPLYHPDDARMNDLARTLAIGLTPEGIARGVWDVIPWTWLIGWFTNVGKYVNAYSLTVPATHGATCFMSEAKAELRPSLVTATNFSSRSFELSKGSATRTIKTRQVSSSVSVGVNMPYLDMSRLSVLGALFSQRAFR